MQTTMLVLHPVQDRGCCYATKGQGETFPFNQDNAVAAPMALLGSELPQEVAQIQEEQNSPGCSAPPREWGLNSTQVLGPYPTSQFCLLIDVPTP